MITRTAAVALALITCSAALAQQELTVGPWTATVGDDGLYGLAWDGETIISKGMLIGYLPAWKGGRFSMADAELTVTDTGAVWHKAEPGNQEATITLELTADRASFSLDTTVTAAGPSEWSVTVRPEAVRSSEDHCMVWVDDRLRTTQRHIYAAGDCIGSFQFTHYAGWQATMATRNALLPGTSKGIREWVPWTTFTDPEVAHAGFTEAEAREKYGDAVEITEWPMEKVDRARAEVDASGLVKLVHKKNGTVLGVTIVCERASELLQEWMLVLESKASVRDVTTVMHVYPGYARANVKAGGALLQKQLLSGRMGKVILGMGHLMLRWMRWTRGI